MSESESASNNAMVADGVRIALAGVFLELKNRILVDALSSDSTFDEEWLVVAAHSALRRVANEASEVAARADRRELPPPSSSDGDAHHVHHAQLTMAPAVYRAVAQELRLASGDEERCLGLVRQAQLGAADELRREVVRKLTTDYSRDELYERDREKRVRKVGKDLRRLRRSRR